MDGSPQLSELSVCLRTWPYIGLASFTHLLKMSGTLTGLRSYCEPAMVDAGALAAGILSDAPKSARMGQACEEVLRQTQNKSKCDTIACPISF